MNEIKNKLGDSVTTRISDTMAYCTYPCENGGVFYVVFWDAPQLYDYYPIEFVSFSVKPLTLDNFDSIKVGESTLEDVTEIDPAVEVTYIDYGEEKFTTHLTKDGIVKNNYATISDKVVVDSVEVIYQDLVALLNN